MPLLIPAQLPGNWGKITLYTSVDDSIVENGLLKGSDTITNRVSIYPIEGDSCRLNNSGIYQRDIQIIDSLPTDVTYISDTLNIPLKWKVGNKCCWELGKMPAHTYGSFELEACVSPNVQGSTILVNNIEIKNKYYLYGIVDSDSMNNTAIWKTHVEDEPKPDVFVKINSKREVRPNETKQVTIFYGNRGVEASVEALLSWSSSPVVGVSGLKCLGSLQPGETGQMQFYVIAPNFITSIYESAQIIYFGDSNSVNNKDIYYEQVVASKDPNDKLSSP